VHFGAVSLHPAAALLACLTAIVVIQFLGWPGLALAFPVVMLTARESLSRWPYLLRRMRWLLMSVWLILAYGTSGDAIFNVAWLPTHEGVLEATLHVARLGLMLGCLAWLFSSLGHQGLLAALHPLARLGITSERLVVRLALVMQNLQTELPKGAWRDMLDGGNAVYGGGPETLQVATVSWRTLDYVTCLAVLGFSCFLIVLG